MKKLLIVLAVFVTAALPATSAPARSVASFVDAVCDGDPGKIHPIGTASSPYPRLRGISCGEFAEMQWVELEYRQAAEKVWMSMPVQATADTSSRTWQRQQLVRALNCAAGVLDAYHPRSASEFRSRASGVYNRIMSQFYALRYYQQNPNNYCAY